MAAVGRGVGESEHSHPLLVWFGCIPHELHEHWGASETAVIAFAWDLLGARAKGKCWQESGLILLA